MKLARTLSRPRWAMPMTISWMPSDGQRREDRFEQRHERLAAFERKAFLADVARVQKPLERFRREQVGKDAALDGGFGRGHFGPGLDAVAHPVAHVRGADVHELRADRAGVDALERGEHFAQAHGLAAHEIARGYDLIEVAFREAEGFEGQERLLGRGVLERVELGEGVAERAVGRHGVIDAALAREVGLAGRGGSAAVGPRRAGRRVAHPRANPSKNAAHLSSTEAGSCCHRA